MLDMQLVQAAHLGSRSVCASCAIVLAVVASAAALPDWSYTAYNGVACTLAEPCAPVAETNTFELQITASRQQAGITATSNT